MPPTMPPEFLPGGLAEPDDADMTGVTFAVSGSHIEIGIADAEDHDGDRRRHFLADRETFEGVATELGGMAIAIDYQDSRGRLSRRRITMRQIFTDGSRTYLQAFCHERQAPRSFRFDRIVEVIDVDGVCHEPRSFFIDELGLAIPEPAAAEAPVRPAARIPSPPTDPGPDIRFTDRPGMAHRRAARDGLRVLVALARSDGLMHEDEIEVILSYIAERSDLAGIAMNEADRAALIPYLRRQYPSDSVLSDCLRSLNAASRAEQRLLVRHAIQLANADGVQDPAEFALLMEIQQELG